jgi:chromosome segregation ATPase
LKRGVETAENESRISSGKLEFDLEIERAGHVGTRGKLDALRLEVESNLDESNIARSDMTSSFESERDGYTTEISSLQSELTEMKSKVDSESSNSRSSFKEMESAFEIEKASHLAAQIKLTSVRSELTEMKSKVDSDRSTFTDLESALEVEWTSHCETKTELDSVRNDLNEMKMKLDSESSEASSALSDLKSVFKKEQASHLLTRSKLDSMQVEVDSASRDEGDAKLQNEVDGLKREKSLEIIKINDSEKEVLAGECRTLQAKVDELSKVHVDAGNDDGEKIAQLLEKNLSLTEDLSLMERLLSETRRKGGKEGKGVERPVRQSSLGDQRGWW